MISRRKKEEKSVKKWFACLLAAVLAVSMSGTVLADSEKPEWEYSDRYAKITKYNGPGALISSAPSHWSTASSISSS